MKNLTIFLALVSALVMLSCEVSDPGSPLGNAAPTTAITSAPHSGSQVNHYLTLRWRGNDSDGTITGFNMYIDGQLVAFTQRTDSTISFAAPATGEPVSHTFGVQAVDNEGAADADYPEIQFSTTNTGPTCDFSSDNTVRPNQDVGQGFRLKLEADDGNRSGVWFAVSVDDTTNWSAWSTDSVFLFADTSLGGFIEGMVVLSNASLTEGAHTIYARCRDSGQALSPIISRTVNVSLDYRPLMAGIPARYNHGIASDSLYADGSVYRSNNADLILTIEANAGPYRGILHSFRYRESSGDWSPWQLDPELQLSDLPLGEYEYQFQARDVAGVVSDTATLNFSLIAQQLSDSILIVDEARESLANVSDEMVDTFYSALVEGYSARNIDLFERGNSPLGTYLSPKDVEHIGLIIWNSDERSNLDMGSYRRILSEFLSRGGRVIFSGQDVMSSFNSDVSSLTFSGSVFEYKYLRVETSHRDPGPATINAQGNGFIGENGYPSVQLDSAKVALAGPASWGNALPRAWTFEPRGECAIIGRLTTRNPDYFLNGEVTAYVYDLSFRVAVFGIPLFYAKQDQAEALFDVLLPRMLAGLDS